MIASSTVRPWSDIKAAATTYAASARSASYDCTNLASHFGSASREVKQQNENLVMNNFGTYGLLYVLNSNNSGSITWRNKITCLMDKWPALVNDQPKVVGVDEYYWADPLASAFLAMLISFDNIQDDLTAVQVSSYTVMFDSFIAQARSVNTGSWYLNSAGVYSAYSIWRATSTEVYKDTDCYHVFFTGNDRIYPPAICNSRQSYHGLSSEVSAAQLNGQGISGSGSSYAWARIGGSSREKMGKWGGHEILQYTGYDNFLTTPTYSNRPPLSNFFDWLFAAHTTPWNTKVSFGDTANNQSPFENTFQGMSTIYGHNVSFLPHGMLVASRYSPRTVSWSNRMKLVANDPVVYPGELIDYIAVNSTITTITEPIASAVVPHGGAAFWDEDQSSQTLQGVLNNVHLTKDDHFYTGDINGLWLGGYGRNLISGPGLGASTQQDMGGFTIRWRHDDAHSGNVLLMGDQNYANSLDPLHLTPSSRYNDAFYNWNPFTQGTQEHQYVGNPTVTPLYGGDGIEESILGNGFDYATGIATGPYIFYSTSTGVTTASLGQNYRNFMFVHADTPAVGGYWAIDDEVYSSSYALVNQIWHPYGLSVTTRTASTEWDWLIYQQLAQSSGTLTLFAASPPSSVLFSSGAFSDGTATALDANGSKYYPASYINNSYAVRSSSAHIMTLFYPSDSRHPKSTFTRLSDGEAEGAQVLSPSTTDYWMASGGTLTVTLGGGATFKGNIGFMRKQSGSTDQLFLRKGTSFNDGSSPRLGISAALPVSAHMTRTAGDIYLAAPTTVTFYASGITSPTIDGTLTSWATGPNYVSVYVSSGNHDVAFSTGTAATDTVRGPSDALPSGFQIFPTTNVWNTRVNNMPVHSSSTIWMDIINGHAGHNLHADFGTTYAGALNGIPYNLVNSGTPLVYTTWTAVNYADESDPIPGAGLPIPTDSLAEGDPWPGDPYVDNSGYDKHLILVDTTSHILWEMNQASRVVNTSSWTFNQLSKWELDSNALRTEGWTSADAAGLPIFPGLVRYDEVSSGTINHALRFTLSLTYTPHQWPARHDAVSGGPLNPPLGMRVRMKSGVDISFASPQNQVIFQAMKDYGMFLADNGDDWFVSGAPSANWNDTDLHNDFITVGLPADIFEVVDESAWIVDPNSGAAVNSSSTTTCGMKGHAAFKGHSTIK